jgi:hypothetical protein
VDRVAHVLAHIQPLGMAFHFPAAALQQPDAGPIADQLTGDADPRRPRSDNADIGIDLLIAGEHPRIRQHPAPLYSAVLVQAYDVGHVADPGAVRQ